MGPCGGICCGGYLVDGYVRNLDVREHGGGGNAFNINFEWENPTEEGHDFWLYVDGEATGLVRAASVHVTEPLAAGSHELLVVPVRKTDLRPPDLRGFETDHSDRAVLSWCASPEADTAEYRVYWDAGTGTVDTESALAVVDAVEVDRGKWASAFGCSSGTGAGRIIIDGFYFGEASNATWSITIGASGWTFADADGASGVTRRITRGAGFALSHGLKVYFLDDASAYDSGDVFEFHVGPRCYYITDALEAGSYKFQVTALDGAGNESDPTTAASVTLDPEPQPPTGIVASWDAATKTIAIAWTASTTSGVSYNIYSNWDTVFEELGEYVLEDNAAWSTSETSYDVVFDSAPEGEVLFYVRASKGGVEERNAYLVRVMALSEPESVVDAPELQSAEAVAGGKVRLRWQQPLDSGGVESHNIYRSATGGWGDAELVENFEAAPVRSTTSFARLSVHVETTTEAHEGLYYWGVRAVDEEGVESAGSNMIGVTGDADAPATPGCFNITS